MLALELSPVLRTLMSADRSLTESPIFVAGPGRSGTSAVLLAVANHPDILPIALGEGPFIDHLSRFAGEYWLGADAEYNRGQTAVTEAEWMAMLRAVAFLHINGHRSCADLAGKKYWVTKAARGCFPDIEMIRLMFPKRRIMFVIRNGIENVHSTLSYAPQAYMGFYRACTRWAVANQDSLPRLKDPFVATLRHEQIVVDPDTAFRTAFAALEMPHSDLPARHIASNIWVSSFQRKGLPRDAFRGEAAEIWDGWSYDRRAGFREICGPTMVALGYWQDCSGPESRWI